MAKINAKNARNIPNLRAKIERNLASYLPKFSKFRLRRRRLRKLPHWPFIISKIFACVAKKGRNQATWPSKILEIFVIRVFRYSAKDSDISCINFNPHLTLYSSISPIHLKSVRNPKVFLRLDLIPSNSMINPLVPHYFVKPS